MPIDSSIYANLRGPDIGGALEGGFKMRDMMDERKLKQKQLGEDEAIKQARLSSVKTNPDGSTSFDRQGFKSLYSKINPEKADEWDQKDQLSTWTMAKAQNDLQGQILGSVSGNSPQELQDTWSMAKKKSVELGLIKPGDVPDQYNPELHNSLLKRTMSAKDQLDYQLKNRELDIKAKEKKAVDPVTSEIKSLRVEQMRADAQRKQEEADYKKSAKGRLEKLNGSDKARYDNVTGALTAITGMTNAYNDGDNTFRLVGDNNFTRNRRVFEEMIGRMQSGGAIQNDEAERFRELVPTARDSEEQQVAKLAQMRDLMVGRFRTLGFNESDANDLGFEQTALFGAPKKQKLADEDAEAEKRRARIAELKAKQGKTYVSK